MATSQHRCVFVGNIPYDATEEQLIEICQEVGPVVSFRLVIDRETGKPKGYGFCEYKDEETALSARRNLQGYEINGRQLRVDFAENDKGADRSRDQGRGGPGLAANVDLQKQLGGPAIQVDSAQHQPIGLHIAITAASVMAGALGGPQAGTHANQLQGQSAPANDPLTLHLARMSRNQLNEIISALKIMATQNKQLARELLLAKPELAKALFQAQIMLGMVTPQLLQMSSIRQGSNQPLQPSFLEVQPSQQQAVQSLPGLPPVSQVQSGLVPKVEDGQVSLPQNSLIQSQFSARPHPVLRPLGPPQHANPRALQQVTLPGQLGVSSLPSVQPQPSNSFSIGQQVHATNVPFLNQQHMQPSIIRNPGMIGTINLGHSGQMVQMSTALQPDLMHRSSLSDAGYQLGPSISSDISQPINNNADRPVLVAEKTSRVSAPLESVSRPPKMIKLDDQRGSSLSEANLNVSNSRGSAPTQVLGGNTVSKLEEVQYSEKQPSQQPLPSEVESGLLQQVLSLSPEQLSSLPPEQQQQVIQLQQMLRREQILPS